MGRVEGGKKGLQGQWGGGDEWVERSRVRREENIAGTAGKKEELTDEELFAQFEGLEGDGTVA